MTGLSWTHEARSIPQRGLELEREATTGERAAVAAALGLASCDRLKVHYRVWPLDQGRFGLRCAFELSATQECVVTLEPIPQKYAQSFEIELWPEKDLPQPADGLIDAFAENEPEGFADGIIDIGQIILDRLIEVIDPYPRKPGAVFDWNDDTASSSEPAGPFAKLKQLRPSS